MRKTFLFQTFLWCVLAGFIFTLSAQEGIHSLDKAPQQTNSQLKYLYDYYQDLNLPVMDGVETGFGSAFDLVGFVNNDFASMPIPAGTPITDIATYTTLIQGGDIANGVFYGTDAGALVTFDLVSGAKTTVGTITGVTSGQTITALGYDESSSTMYMGTTDVIATSQLYTVDLTTGAATLVGTVGQTGLIAIAVSCAGEIYSVDLITDDLWSIDPTTGVGTSIGPLGYDANFAQDADWNAADGMLYLAAYNNTIGSGELRTADVTTGATTLLAGWPNDEITAFGIDATCGAPCPVQPPTNPTPPDGATDVPVSGNTAMWTNGSGTTAVEVWFGEPGSLVQVYDGTPITSLSLAGVEPLNFATLYQWRVVDKNDTCSASATWSFTTMQDPNLVCVFTDDFSDTTLAAWTINNLGGTCDWVGDDVPWANSYTLPATSTGGIMRADADDCGSGTTIRSEAIVGPFDATNYQAGYVKFDNDWRHIDADDSAVVQVSTDGGTTWMVAMEWIGVSNRNTTEEIDISAMIDQQPQFWVRFLSIQPGFDWWWAIDNVEICIYDFIPVELSSFTASVGEGNVTLNWSTATETNNQGFEVQRAVNGEFEVVGYVDGNGTTTEVQNYSFTDRNVQAGTYSYRLRQIDLDGTFEYSSTIEVDVTAPKEFALDQNYPNPFNPSTKIAFRLATDANVTLKVFDVLGQEVMSLISGDLTAGSHEVNFDASGINSGVYFYRIDAKGIDGTDFSSVKKMILTK